MMPTKEYEKALLIAPWLAIDDFNRGVGMYEKAGKFNEAIAAVQPLSRGRTDAQDARTVRKRDRRA